jgi:elongation factor P
VEVIGVGDIRNGHKVEIDNEAYEVVDAQHVKPGKGGAFCRTKMKNLRTGSILERTFRVGEKLPVPDLEEKEVQYLYTAEEQFWFMDLKSYEQVFLTRDQIGESKNYLKENMNLKILYFNNRPIGIDLPLFVELRVVQADPGIRGDTASGGTKPAVLETGAVVKVPLYLNEGEKVKVDTRTGTFIERVK